MSGDGEHAGAESPGGVQGASPGPDQWRAGDEPAGQDGERRPGRDSGKDAAGETGPDGAPDRADEAERAERRDRQEERFREATGDPLADSGVPGEARAAARVQRAAQARFDIRGNSSVFDRTSFDRAHFGDVYIGARDAAAPVFGDVPEDELDRLRQVYRAPAGYPTLKRVLRARRVLVLGGPPGTGRLTTGLCLLDEVTTAVRDTASGAGEPVPEAAEADGRRGTGVLTRGRVTRLAPSDLRLLSADPAAVASGVLDGGGLLVQLPENGGDFAPPQELHLDALAARLAAKGSYAVLVVSPSSPAGHLLAGRYGLACPPAPAGELLEWQLVRHLADCPDPDALGRGEQILKHPLFLDALGILPEALRPSETELVAERVARHVRGELSRDALLDACGRIARRQAREWFTGTADPLPPAPEPGPAGADGPVDTAAPRVREASFRIALAVLDGEAVSSVADAAELLAQQILAVRTPGRAHGRPVFAEDLEGLLAACRAEVRTAEEESVGGVPVPVRTVAYRGTALAGSVLAEVWHRHHAARGPVARWLRDLAVDPRPQVWVRAAVVAGELATADLGYGFAELIRPLSVAKDTRRRFFAATALSQAAGREPYRSAVRGVVTDWADAPVPALRWTAALALGSGRIVDDTRQAMELLCRIGGRDEGAQALVASYGATRLVAGSRAGEAATVLREWSENGSAEQLNLAMLCAVRLFCARTDDMWQAEESDGPGAPPADAATSVPASVSRVWGPGGVRLAGRMPGQPGGAGQHARTGLDERPRVPRASVEVTDAELARRAHWPLVPAVAVAVESAAEPLADLLWRSLANRLSHQAATEGLATWLRAAEADAVVPGRAGRIYVFEQAAGEGPADGTAGRPGEILQALLWLLPRMIRDRRDAERLRWLLRLLVDAPEEPMTAAFARHVVAAMAAAGRGRSGRGEEHR
ncbi:MULTISPECIES: hypothetical protein [Streptomyces]|uniref:Uncharacterized protein n=2 Tax=Streptomyces TaxID=1883 RepID=A0A2U9P9X0_STRAS|nr:hypothetical protein [Streptomyces actuosus]AWT45994.1 hypothetical protein DMT42_29365 [Streptomyces actuosus]MBM4822648.1 hypothetical protein [Streptomyces actuosus]